MWIFKSKWPETRAFKGICYITKRELCLKRILFIAPWTFFRLPFTNLPFLHIYFFILFGPTHVVSPLKKIFFSNSSKRVEKIDRTTVYLGQINKKDSSNKFFFIKKLWRSKSLLCIVKNVDVWGKNRESQIWKKI